MLPQRGDPGFTFAGILALAALSAFMWKAGPLETARPVSTSAGWHEFQSDSKVPARLWQDPFKAVFGLGERGNDKAELPDTANLAGQIRGYLKIGESVTLLAVMATPGSYAEITERRRRQRYAVVSGLADAGYVPRDPESLQVAEVALAPLQSDARPHDAQPQGSAPGAAYEQSRRMPYEWYAATSASPGGPQQVSVIWLDESWLAGAPYKRIRQLLEQWLPEIADAQASGLWNGRIALTVLGPARSESLLEFWGRQRVYNPDLNWLRASCLSAFSVLSPSATAVPEAMDRQWFQGVGLFYPICNPTPLKFTSTIHDDAASIGELVRELNYRGVKGGAHHVAVISEWDTYYGRYLPRVFEDQYCSEVEASGCKVLRFTYQRGIDGIALTAESVENSEQKDAAAAGRGPLQIGPVEVRRPVGRSQFDYLRRLAESVRDRDRKLRLQVGSGGIRAVAVLGSDVYDKLLILRALRPQLPGTLWLTTDLDAQMLHPDEFPWTRNMVVASSTGLRLRSTLGVSVPPFRDNYQSSIYVATRLTLDPGWRARTNLAPVAETLPMLYEIGRRRPVALSAPPDVADRGRDPAEIARQAAVRAAQRAANVSALEGPPLRADATVVAVASVLAIALLLIVAYHQTRPAVFRRALGLAAVVVVMGALTVLGVWSDHIAEPFAFNDGVSIWPTVYLRAAATIIAIVLVFHAIEKLRYNREQLHERYFSDNGGAATTTAPGRGSASNATLPTAVVSALFLLVFFVFMISLRGLEYALAYKVALVLTVWGVLAVAWWAYIYRGHSPVRSVNEWISSSQPDKTIAQLWREYGEHGEPVHRFMRAVAFMTLYLAFATTVFTLLGGQPSPCRGFACGVDRIVVVVSVLSMLFLLFFVVDATRLCAAWIDLMARPGRAWGSYKERWFSKALDLEPGVATAWMQVRLIGERTTEVARLIYFPMIVILVMLIARSTYFDDWGFPKALAIVVGLNFAIALGCGVLLRRSACRGREKILDALRQRQMALAYEERVKQETIDSPTRIRDQVQELEELQIGAYRNLRDQPVFRAAILVGSGLGLVASEYLLAF